MNDPFAMLDPTAKPSQPQAGSGAFATAPYGGYAPGFQQQQPQPNPFGAGNPPVMAPWKQQQQLLQPSMQPPMQQAYPYGGAMFMTQQGPPAFGGLSSPPGMATAPYLPQPQQPPPQYPSASGPFGGQPIAYDSIRSLLQPKGAAADPFATDAGASNPFGDARPAEPTSAPRPPPAPLATQTSPIVVDFDPFSPQNGTPRTPFDFPESTATDSGSLADRQPRRQTQEAQRSQLGFSADGFASVSTKVSLRDVTSTGTPPPAGSGSGDDPFFSDGSDPFAGQTFANLDDEQASAEGWAQLSTRYSSEGGGGAANGSADDLGACAEDEYDVTFETGRKLGVLMERVDVWTAQSGRAGSGERRVETAVVKLVVENGAADRVDVTVGSSVVAINRHRVDRDGYAAVLDMIKAAPRPLVMRFRRGTVNKDTTQGSVLTRISNGTFSVGNLTSGNAVWSQKYFAFGGAKMDVLQLFVSRAAYHECVIALYEKRPVHTKIQSFRLCSDHKLSPIKSKIYKGYGNLHYFSLSVPSLRFIAAKFASEDHEAIKNLWSNAYDAIERKKRMGYPY